MEQQELLIRQCLEGNPADAQSTFNSLMLARIEQSINGQRQEIANHMFIKPQAVAA